MPEHRVVAPEEWLAARRALLEREKAFTRDRDRLSAARRALPWVKVEKAYEFDSTRGRLGLPDLFAGRSQLVVYHFMFGPGWEAGCPSCSFWADGYDPTVVHLAHRDITLVAVSRGPLEDLLRYRERMGWRFEWVSSLGSDFNYDFHVSFTEEERAAGEVEYNYARTTFPSEEAPGLSVFYRDAAGDVFHTYSCYARGLDMLNAAYHVMDLVPKGRDETELPWSMAWLRRHDEYDDERA